MAKPIARESIVDPTQIQSSSQIPPPGSQHAGVSPEGLVDVYYGTIAGDVDAQPSAEELLRTSLDTGGLSNSDYIYAQVSALYGGVQLPVFQSPSGNSAKSVVFVSGSSQGGYGAFHIDGTQAEFDRIVVDSLTVSGSYSPGSGLGAEMVPVTARRPHLLPLFRGTGELLSVVRMDDPRLKRAKPAEVHEALVVSAQCAAALRAAFEAWNPSVAPTSSAVGNLSVRSDLPEATRLVYANMVTVGLLMAVEQTAGSRRYLSTALFAAEIVESFEKLTEKGNPGKTDGESVSRVVAFKLAPEIALIPGFNGAVVQQWWKDGHLDFVNVNTESDQSVDGNGAGVMFLEFLTDYLGIPLDSVILHMPSSGGAPLGETYAALLKDYPALAAGADSATAFQKMVSLLQHNTLNPDGSLSLPADGNPFPGMPGSKQGGLSSGHIPSGALRARAALSLQAQLVRQSAELRPTLRLARVGRAPTAVAPEGVAFAYGPSLASPLVEALEKRAAPFRVPQYDQVLQQEFWPHVYNELPGSGPYTGRLQVITGTDQSPLAVQTTGTITETQLEPDGDLHVYFLPDDPNFPVNQGPGESPLVLEIIYAGPVTQPDAKKAEAGFANPFDVSQLIPGTRIMAAGPLVFDRVHGAPTPDGNNVDTGLEVHPVAGMTVLKAATHAKPLPSGELSNDLASALGWVESIEQTLVRLKAILREMAGDSARSSR